MYLQGAVNIIMNKTNSQLSPMERPLEVGEIGQATQRGPSLHT